MEKDNNTHLLELTEQELQISGGSMFSPPPHHVLMMCMIYEAGAAIINSVRGAYMAGYEDAMNNG